MIVVLGATGNVGSKITAKLQETNTPFLGIGLANSEIQGFRRGDLMDRNFLEQILSGATSLLTILPGSLYPVWHDYAALLRSVLEESQVSHIVNISNAVTEKNGSPSLLHSFEKELNLLSALNIKHLRCANFFDNLSWGLNNGYHGDLKLPYISTHEIAFVASGYLVRRNFSGHSIEELLGPADYSMNDFSALTGKGARQMLLTEESRSFFEPFNQGLFTIAPRTGNNTTSHSDPRFYLEYFLKNEYRGD
ncbi:hypothetical protein GZH53_01635 [Flavihumibacter sp. R14]|nr:hypothetical protein [Flavihumibacter soli]